MPILMGHGDTTMSIRRAYRDVRSDHASVKIEGVPTAADRRRGQLTSGSTLPHRGQITLVSLSDRSTDLADTYMHQRTLTDQHVASVCDGYDDITVDNCTSGICRLRQRRYVAFDDEIAVNTDLLTDLKLDSDIDNYGSNYCRAVRTGRPNLKNELTLTDVDDITYVRGRKLKSFAHVDAPSTGHDDGGTYDPRQFVSSRIQPTSTQRQPVCLQSDGYYLDAYDLPNPDRPLPDVRCRRGRGRTPDFMDRDDRRHCYEASRLEFAIFLVCPTPGSFYSVVPDSAEMKYKL